MSFQPTPQDIQHVLGAANDTVGIKLTDAQALEVFECPAFLSNYQQFGMDTVGRGELANFFAKKLLGRSWPTYGDTMNHGEFVKLFDTAAKKAGYEVL